MSTRYVWEKCNIDEGTTSEKSVVDKYTSWYCLGYSYSVSVSMTIYYSTDINDVVMTSNTRGRINNRKTISCMWNSRNPTTAVTDNVPIYYTVPNAVDYFVAPQNYYSDTVFYSPNGKIRVACDIVYHSDDYNNPDPGHDLYAACSNSNYCVELVETVTQIKGSVISNISSDTDSTYPNDNISGNYWYTYKGSDSIDPTRVTIPSSIKGGNRISISVTKSSTNTYGGTITYQYQIRRNGSSTWTTLGSTTATSYRYTVPVGTTSIQARVLASDNTGFTSTDYVTSRRVTVTNNTAPSTPSSISVPSSVQAGKAFTVSWGASTDADGNLSGYTLQRKLNSGSYTTIYTGSSRSYQDTIPKSGYTSVTYRVCAYDTDGATSSYRTSNTAAVINNVAPVISGSNQNLGVFTYNPPTISYVVTDENNDTVTVTVKLDSSNIESRTVTLGQTYTVPISWWDIGTGIHTATITADDGQGGTATRTYTFTKNSVGQISFNRLHKKISSGYQTTYIETDTDSIITNNGQILSERLSDIASKLSTTINTTPTEMVSRHRLHIKLTSEYTIDYLEMYSTNVKVGTNTLESILTQLESKVGISNGGTVPSDLNFERWRMKNSSGEYDIIYLEGVSEHIICPCGKSVEERLVAIESKL